MDFLNKDGTITILGINFSFPKKENLNKWDYGIDKKEKESFVWLEHYHSEGNAIMLWQYNLKRIKGGKIFLDDKPLKKEDKEKAEYIFKELGL